LLKLVRKVAPSRATLLIQGESGTGKELIARQIHALSRRHDMPFVAVNCAALPQHLLESELFGHEKGAFTGAVNRKLGKFELAHRGTLLLDEISEMDLGLQAKLLRVLQESELDRVGGRLPVAIDTRVLATTNRNLEEMVAESAFRQDLYYRLDVVRLVLPPLRERCGDILPLTSYFLKKFINLNNLSQKKLSPAAENVLLGHHWPGNVRELENTLERAVLLAEEEIIHPEHLFPGEKHAASNLACRGEANDLSLKKMEKRMIQAALDRHGGNRTHAANVLGISVRTLRNKLNEYKSGDRPQ
jgi:two-component system response regulator FlrC